MPTTDDQNLLLKNVAASFQQAYSELVRFLGIKLTEPLFEHCHFIFDNLTQKPESGESQPAQQKSTQQITVSRNPREEKL